MTFTDRCAIATACLPRADYRAKLEALHAEMLAAIANERERCAVLVETLTYRARWVSGGMNGAPVAPCELAAAIRN